MYPNNDNNKIKIKNIKVKSEGTDGVSVWREREEIFLFFIFFASFLDLRKFDY